MRNFLFLSLAIVIGLPAGQLHADAATDAAARARQIAPYLDEQVIAVGRIDLGRVDVKGLFAQLPNSIDRQTIAVSEAALQLWMETFRKAGGAEIYVVGSLADVPEQPPFLIVPLRDGVKERDVADLLKQISFRTGATERLRFETCVRLDNVLFAGSPQALDRARKKPAAPRPGLADAFAAAGESAAQLLFVPSDDHRRVFREMLGQPPDRPGVPLGTILADGVHWLALGVDLPPKVSLRWVVQSADAAAARELSSAIQQGTDEIGRMPAVQSAVPNVERLLKMLVPSPAGDRLTLTLGPKNEGIEGLRAAGWPIIEATIKKFRREQSVKSLKQIGLALHNIHDAFNSFPPRANYDPRKQPLLSWRVHILPYVGAGKLHSEFHLHEPWDSPHNRPLIERMPDVYSNGNWRLEREGKTTFLAPIGEQTVFSGREGISIRDITDGTSNTIFVVDVADDRAVVWTRPEDWEFDPEQPMKGLAGKFDGGFSVLMCDGSVRFLSETIKPEILRALFTRNGGEPVGDF
jgi:hypothetical protein